MSDLRISLALDLLDKATAPLRRAAGAAKAMATGAGQAQAKLRELEHQHRNIGALQQHVAQQKRLGVEWAQSTTRVRELNLQLKAAQQEGTLSAKAMRALERETLAARTEAGRLKNAFFSQGQAAQAMRDRLTKAGISTSSLASHEARLRTQIDSTTKAIERRSRAMAQSAKMAKAGAAMTASGAAGMFAGRETGRRSLQMMQTGGDFQQTMSKVQALTRLDKESPELAALRSQSRQLGADTMFSATQAAEGQAFLAMSGFKPQQIMAAMPGMLDMAKAGDMEIGRTADISSNILQAFRLPAEQMGRVADVLTLGFTTANVNLEMLGNTMTYVAPIAHEFGASIEDATAMAGLLGNAGIQGEKAGTALRSMFTRLASPPKAAAKALQSLGVKTMNSAGKMRPMVEILGDVAAKTEKMGNGKRLGVIADIFGLEAASGGAAMLKEAAGGNIAKYIGILNNSEGAAARTAKVMADNWRGSIDEMSSAWDDVKIGLFDQNADTLRALTDTATEGIRRLSKFLDANPMVGKALFWAATAATAFMVASSALLIPLGLLLAKGALLRFVLTRLGLSFGGIARGVMLIGRLFGSGLVSALRMAGTAFMWAGRGLMILGRAGLAFVMTPLGATLAAVAAAAFAAYMVWKHWDKVGPMLTAAWATIKAVFSAGWTWIKAQVAAFWNAGADLMNGLVGGITSRLAAVRDAITGAASQAVGWFKEKLGIQSPSRVFMEMGGFVSEGAALGIASRAPLVARAAAAMAALPALAATPAMAAAGPGIAPPGIASPAPAAAGGNTYKIEVHVTGTADSQAIAEAVRKAITEHERARTTGRNGRMTD